MGCRINSTGSSVNPAPFQNRTRSDPSSVPRRLARTPVAVHLLPSEKGGNIARRAGVRGAISLSAGERRDFKAGGEGSLLWLTNHFPLALTCVDAGPGDLAMDHRMEPTGLTYARFMDDWVILAPARWSLRRAVRMVN